MKKKAAAPYKCPYPDCPYGYKQKKMLDRHIATHPVGRWYIVRDDLFQRERAPLVMEKESEVEEWSLLTFLVDEPFEDVLFHEGPSFDLWSDL